MNEPNEFRNIALARAIDAAREGTYAYGNAARIIEIAEQFTKFLEGLVEISVDVAGTAEPEDKRPDVPYWVHRVAVTRVNDLERELNEASVALVKRQRQLEKTERQCDHLDERAAKLELHLNKLRDMVLNGEF